MSEIGCEIQYDTESNLHESLIEAMKVYSSSGKSEADKELFERSITDLGVCKESLLSADFWDFGIKKLQEDRYEIYFCTKDSDFWSEIIPSVLCKLGGENIFGYAHDTSWGGDIFIKNQTGETEYVYVSQEHEEFDGFLYGEGEDYIGTSCTELRSIYQQGKFKGFDTEKYNNPPSESAKHSKPSQDTMLVDSLVMQDVNGLDQLLKEGACLDVPVLRYIGMTPLEIAINYDNPKMIATLIKNGALNFET